MIKGGKGGAKTQVGLAFEGRVSLLSVFSRAKGYSVVGDTIRKGEEVIAQSFSKNKLYKFLEEHGVDYTTVLSKKLLPDEALYFPAQKKLFIVEIKFQEVAGSVDEKLQTCDFKKRQYLKLFKPMGIKVEYIYILNDWFKKPEYRDVLAYINDVGCHYFFHTLPFEILGLPE